MKLRDILKNKIDNRKTDWRLEDRRRERERERGVEIERGGRREGEPEGAERHTEGLQVTHLALIDILKHMERKREREQEGRSRNNQGQRDMVNDGLERYRDTHIENNNINIFLQKIIKKENKIELKKFGGRFDI